MKVIAGPRRAKILVLASVLTATMVVAALGDSDVLARAAQVGGVILTVAFVRTIFSSR